jgi:hypothetical protein
MLATRIQHLTNAGSIERAAATLDPQILTGNTPEAIQHLRTLHPLEPPPPIPAVDVPPLTCDEETLAQVARGLKRGKALGECDGTYEMLQARIFGCVAGLRTCLAFLNAMLAFATPRVDAVFKSRGVALEMPNIRGVQPTAICEPWLRLAAIVCIRLLPDTGPSLARAWGRHPRRSRTRQPRHQCRPPCSDSGALPRLGKRLKHHPPG